MQSKSANCALLLDVYIHSWLPGHDKTSASKKRVTQGSETLGGKLWNRGVP